MIVYTIIGWKQHLKSFAKGFSYLDFALIAFVAVQVASISWATNTALAFSSSFRDVALLVSFLFLKSVWNSDERWQKRLPILVNYAFSVYLLVTWYQLAGIAEKMGLNAQTVYLLRYPTETKNLASLFILVNCGFSIWVALNEQKLAKTAAIVNLIVATGTLFLFSTRGISISVVAVGISVAAIQLLKAPFKAKKAYTSALILIAIGISHWFSSNLQKDLIMNKFKAEKQVVNMEDLDSNSDDHQYRSSNERLSLWEKSVKLILQDPLFGVGAGNWQIEYPRNGLDGLERAELRVTSFKRPHNEALWILSETGLVGFSLFSLVLVLFFTKSVSVGGNTLIYAFSMVAFVTAAMFDFPRERMEHNLLFALLLVSVGNPSNLIKLDARLLKSIPIIMIATGLLGSTIYNKRYVGERNYEQVRALKAQKNYVGCIDAIKNTESVFYTVDWINYPFSWFEGVCYTYLNQFEAGEAKFRDAIELNPGNFHSHNNLGFCVAQQERYEEAIPHFERSLEINTQFEEARFNLAYSFTMLKQFDNAEKILSKNIRDTDKLAVYLSNINSARKASAIDSLK